MLFSLIAGDVYADVGRRRSRHRVFGSATAFANVGPGLGEVIGPAGNYQSLPDAAKWVLAFMMILGRLEFFTILVLLTPAFWRG